MKIEGDAPNSPITPADRPDGAARVGDPATVAARRQQTAGQTDGLHLSPEAQMVQAAVQTAAGLPEIRQDVVERMRALLDRGEVGNDAGRLADSLIDRWLTTP